MQKINSISVLIKPSSSQCNINCKYCFYNDVAENRSQKSFGFMSIDTLEETIKRIFEVAGNYASIAFQGGEPTLIGIDFYENYIKLIEKYNVNRIVVQSSIQTNGILIDDKWAAFLSKHNFLVGISLDGEEALHDKYRLDRKNEGTHNRVHNSIKLLKKYKVKFNVLQVLTKDNAKDSVNQYRYFMREGIEFVQPIPLLRPLDSKACDLTCTLSPDEYAEYLIKTFEIWKKNIGKKDSVRIVYFENLVSKLMGDQNLTCGLNGRCTIQFVVEGNGTVYPCDYYVLNNYELGNVKNDSFIDMLKTKRADIFVYESIEMNKNCRSCKWYSFCGGGCKRHWQMAEEQYAKNYFCDAYKKFFSYAHSDLKYLAESYK